MRLRNPDPRRSLTAEQRRELLRYIAAVPPDAEPTHPAVRALIAFRATLKAPWWAGGGTAYLRIGGMCADGRTNTAVGLDLMRRFAECEDWGDEAPRGTSVA